MLKIWYAVALYSNWLRVKGYSDHNDNTRSKKLAQDIISHYGREFLTLFDAYNSSACTWISRIIENKQRFRHPLYNLLLMRFLAGSAEFFFMCGQEKTLEHLPFGVPPYPCRNYVCEYHLKDVIKEIEITKAYSTPYATFVCPHCGFSYRRRGYVPKEIQYTGNIHITEYGWKWEEKVTALLAAGESPYKIARELHCTPNTIFTFGVEKLGISLPNNRKYRRIYIPSDLPREKPGFNEQRTLYRQRRLALIAMNPMITRKELRLLDKSADRWLHMHDIEWLERNSPPSKKVVPSWTYRDDEYLEKVNGAVNQLKDFPGLPKWITIMSVSRISRIVHPYTRLVSDLLPKTKAFVAANVETQEQWRKRKIIWAVRQMRERGELMMVNNVRRTANITDNERKLDEFISECIENSE